VRKSARDKNKDGDKKEEEEEKKRRKTMTRAQIHREGRKK
jgi:hypothetical protein